MPAVPWSGFRQRNQAPVAQLDRAPDYESGGQEFESLRARHHLAPGFRAKNFYGFCKEPSAALFELMRQDAATLPLLSLGCEWPQPVRGW